MSARSYRHSGFTLVELIIVLNIAAILVALLIPAYRTVSAARSQSSCESRLHVLYQQIEEFKRDKHRYPFYLGELYPDYVQSKSALICPADVRDQRGADPRVGGYGYDLLYTNRQTSEAGQELLGGCPFHKKGLVLTIDGKVEKGEFQEAKVQSVSGAVSIVRYNSNWKNGDWERESAAAGKQLHVGDTVVTDVGGQAVLAMDDKGSTVTVDQNTEFTLNLAKSADDPSSLIRLCSMRAAITGNVGHITAVIDPSETGVYRRGGGRFEISTPSAVAAVRGTQFDLWCYRIGDVQTTELTVTQGEVEFISDKGKEKVSSGAGNKRVKTPDDTPKKEGKRKNK